MSFRPIYKPRKWVPNIHHLNYEDIFNNERCMDEVIKQDLVNIVDICAHPGAIDLIEENITNIEHIDMEELSRNTSAVHLFDKVLKTQGIIEHFKHLDYLVGMNDITKLYLYEIAQNERAISFIEKHYGHVLKKDFKCKNKQLYELKHTLTWGLSINSSAMHILEELEDKWIDIEYILRNPYGWKLLEKRKALRKKALKSGDVDYLFIHSEESLKFVLKYIPNGLDIPSYWMALHDNPSDYALEILKKRFHDIDWNILCCNENPNVIEFLKENKDKIVWEVLSQNPSAIELLEEKALENCNSVYTNFDLKRLATNKAIYILDCEKMKENINKPLKNGLSFVEELVQKILHPMRVELYMTKYNYDLLDDCYVE